MRILKHFQTPGAKLVLVMAIALIPQACLSQYPANYTHNLLPANVMDHIVSSSSGELAMKHINHLAPYTRPRSSNEFPANFGESNYIVSQLGEFGIKNSRVDTAGATNAWRAIEGNIWEVSPGGSKIADITDVPEMLVEGSVSTSLRADLIWAGEGDEEFFTTHIQDIKGKIIVTSAMPYVVQPRAVAAGAVGIISFFSGRTLDDPVQVPNTTIAPQGFAFLIPPREGVLLRDRLVRKEKIEVEVKVKTSFEKADFLVPTCLIQGTDTTAGEIIFTAHLFEGFVKMGANDNMSGSAVILETAHLLNDLIAQGKIPRPLRSIRFLWVPEFSGTIPWVNSHLAEVKRAVCDLNIDMAGIRLRANKSFFCLNRSGYSTANPANDVMESCFRYVGESNVEGITDGLGRRGFSRRIISPTGTDDPFYYRIMSLHGSSDNAVFNGWGVGVPGLKMITWPDGYYHSSEDNPDKCDPTQLRRAVVIAASGAYILASGDKEVNTRIAGEMYSEAIVRLGIQLNKASDMILKAGAENLQASYKRAMWNLEGFAAGEKSALERIRQITVNDEVLLLTGKLIDLLDDEVGKQKAALRELMLARCRQLGLPPVVIKLDSDEKNALKIIPHKTHLAETMGYGGEKEYTGKLPGSFLKDHQYKGIVNQDEVAGLADGKRSLLEIKKIVDAEFEHESPLADIINFFAVLKESGLADY